MRISGSTQVSGMNAWSAMMKNNQSKGTLSEKNTLREKLRSMSVDPKDIRSGSLQQTSLIESAQKNAEKLREDRLNTKSTATKTKSLKYKFKDISSKILRSKTSANARQVVSQAKREVIRLKREKQTGKYDSEEIEAAITHATAMERIARKKVKHLLEEEMAKAAGGPCADGPEAEKKELSETDKKSSGTDTADGVGREEYFDDEYVSSAYDEYASSSYADEYDSSAYGDEYVSYSYDNQLEDASLDELFAEMADISTKLLEDVSEDMKEMLEDMMPFDFSEGASKKDMDPADLDMMKIKHRNKEMKEIVKADAKYLKAIFEHYEKMKASGSVPGMSASSGQSGAVSISGIGSLADYASTPVESTIDVAL